MLIRPLTIAAFLSLWLSGIDGRAAQCEGRFVHVGAYPGLQQYSSRVDIPGLTMATAFSQLHTLFAENGMRVLSEDRRQGLIVGELPAALFFPAQPITAQYGSSAGIGTVQLINIIKNGVIATQANMRRQVCGILNRLTDAVGRRPDDPAPKQVAVVRPPAPLPIESAELAREVALARENPARIKEQFGGKSFRVSGTVLQITDSYRGYSVHFAGAPVQGRGDDDATSMLVVCYVPKARANAAAALYPDQRGTLTGRFDRLENHSLLPEVALEDCGI
jgi:hypothetical protein